MGETLNTTQTDPTLWTQNGTAATGWKPEETATIAEIAA